MFFIIIVDLNKCHMRNSRKNLHLFRLLTELVDVVEDGGCGGNCGAIVAATAESTMPIDV